MKGGNSPSTRGEGTPSTMNGESPSHLGDKVNEFPGKEDEEEDDSPKPGVIMRSLLRVTKRFLENEV